MFQAEVDKSAPLLRLSYSGEVGIEEMMRCAERIEVLVQDLQPGFRLLTDLTELQGMDFGCVPHVKRIMDLCNRAGVEMVVRVIPDPHKDIGLNILSLFHYSKGVRIVTCQKLPEALKILAQ